jgi:hypothetical protein
MQRDTIRVVYENQPYLVVQAPDGSAERAYGPFAPGTEPNLSECTPDTEVQSHALLATLRDLLPISPALPPHEDTLAGS